MDAVARALCSLCYPLSMPMLMLVCIYCILRTLVHSAFWLALGSENKSEKHLPLYPLRARHAGRPHQAHLPIRGGPCIKCWCYCKVFAPCLELDRFELSQIGVLILTLYIPAFTIVSEGVDRPANRSS